MPIVNCKICNYGFYAKPNWLKRGEGKYCSNKCSYEGRKNGEIVNCSTCNKKIYKSQKDLKSSKSKKYFCSKSCQAIWRNKEFSGERHANWKKGESVDYKRVLLRHNITPICKICLNEDKRVLCVHHIDKNRKNNNLRNLMWLCYNCHYLVHNYKIKI